MILTVIKIINYSNRDDHPPSLSKTDNYPLLAIRDRSFSSSRSSYYLLIHCRHPSMKVRHPCGKCYVSFTAIDMFIRLKYTTSRIGI